MHFYLLLLTVVYHGLSKTPARSNLLIHWDGLNERESLACFFTLQTNTPLSTEMILLVEIQIQNSPLAEYKFLEVKSYWLAIQFSTPQTYVNEHIAAAAAK
jgi:hypothetical protein